MENESGQIYRELLRNAGEDKYSALSDLVVGMTRIVYGVVIQFSKPRKSSGTDSVVNLILTDPTMPKIADGMVMNFFHPNLWMLPRPEAVGDVIVCAIKIQKYRDKLQGISLKKEYMVHIISKDVADPIASHLREWWTSANAPRADDGVIAYFGRPTLEIKDIKVPNTFCDLVGKVVHCFPYVIGPPSRLQILITDFTENTDISCPLEMSFMPYIDPQYAPKTILSITLWYYLKRIRRNPYIDVCL
ncbi:hypothetical protein DFS34DRAFT_158883 [Phlyctochytrium arcticum]|nr:hypothetical protein DFS34DRAFT_158883 [Phlyctochytrium arcticum]